MPRVPRHVLAVGVLALAGVVVLLVLVIRSPNARPHPPVSTAREASVQVTRSRFGRILVDGRERTLYLYTQDRHGRSTCAHACARVWPPALVSGRPVAGRGVRPAKLHTTRRPNGSRQLVYAGHPLYRFSGDARRGEIGGHRFLDVWYVVSPAGHGIGVKRSKGGYGA